MPTPGPVRFPISLKPHLYRWPAVRAFLLALVVSGALWGAVVWFYFSAQPKWGWGFPAATALAVLAPVVVLVRALCRARRDREPYDFDTLVYLDSTRIVVSHSLKGTRHEVFAAGVHAILLVLRPPGHGKPATAPKLCCMEIVNTDGDVLRSEPHVGPTSLRAALIDAKVAFEMEERGEPLSW